MLFDETWKAAIDALKKKKKDRNANFVSWQQSSQRDLHLSADELTW